MPNRATIPATITTKAPVGPPIWLGARPSQSGDQKSGHDRRVQSCLWCHTRRNTERHRQWQCNQADRNTGKQIMQKSLR